MGAWVLSKGSLCQLSRQAVRVLIRMGGVLLISRATGHPRVDQDVWSAPDFTRDKPVPTFQTGHPRVDQDVWSVFFSRPTGHPRVDQDVWSAPDFTRDTSPW